MDSYLDRMAILITSYSRSKVGLSSFWDPSCMKNLSIKPTDKFMFNNSNIFKYSVMQLVSLLLFGSAFGFSRLRLFKQHHRQRNGMHMPITTVASKRTMKSGIFNKLCTAQTCSKCHKVLTSHMVLSTKMQNSCKILVHNHACCPNTFKLLNGFWIFDYDDKFHVHHFCTSNFMSFNF